MTKKQIGSILANQIQILVLAIIPILGSAQTELRFDVNDVSFLSPLPKTLAQRNQMIGLSRFLSATNLDELIAAAQIPNDKAQFSKENRNLESWRLSAVRLDPCFRSTPQSECHAEIRLSFQVFSLGFFPETGEDGEIILGKDGQPRIVQRILGQDQALHLIYFVQENEKPQFFNKIRRLKALAGVRTLGIPLKPHPILAAESKSRYRPYTQKLNQLLFSFARKSQLNQVTAAFRIHDLQIDGSRPNEDQTELMHWNFILTKPTHKRGAIQLVPQNLVNLPQGTQIQKLRHEFLVGPDGNGNFITKSIDTRFVPEALEQYDNANLIVDPLGPNTYFPSQRAGRFLSLNESQKAQSIEAALRIDNPNFHHRDSVDCLSCHMSSRGLAMVFTRNALEEGHQFLMAQDGNPNRFPIPSGLSFQNKSNLGTLSSADSVRAFGYQAAQISITQGTINSSAQIADEFNRMKK